MAEMVMKTQFAITGEDTRYFLNGALLVIKPDRISLVATDGHRLALISAAREQAAAATTGQGGPDEESRAILPRKTLSELGRLLAEAGEGDLLYSRGENHLFFRIDGRVLISRIIDGQFPAFERVVPRGNDKLVEFDRDRITAAVKRVSLLSNERSRAVKLEIVAGRVEVSSNSPELGDAREVLLVDYNGAPIQICFNAQYVLDFLNVVQSDNIVFELKDEVSQAIMKPVAAEGYDYTYVIMPMRI
jgi:DNA polymerase-3 subunit beta